MTPRPAKSDEKAKLRIVKCSRCKREFPSTMKIPRCGSCGAYTKK